MRYKNIILLLGLSVFITACASQQRQRPKVNIMFVTNITEEGLKIFSFSMTREVSNRGRGRGKDRGGKGGGMDGSPHGGKGGRMGGDRGGRNSDSDEGREDKMKNKVLDALESRLDITGYCREGYSELESYFSGGASQIRGECKEEATQEDRTKFINNHYY